MCVLSVLERPFLLSAAKPLLGFVDFRCNRVQHGEPDLADNIDGLVGCTGDGSVKLELVHGCSFRVWK
jgi:hypothetical protein